MMLQLSKQFNLYLNINLIYDKSTCILLGHSGEIIFMTDKFMQSHDIQNEEQIIGQPIADFIRLAQKQARKTNDSASIKLIRGAIADTFYSGVQQSILITKPYFDVTNDYLVTVNPVYDENSLAAGCMISAYPLNRFEVYQDLYYKSQILKFHVSSFKTDVVLKNIFESDDTSVSGMIRQPDLTLRQKQILFLLYNGVNQYKIAEVLKIKRGTVAKYVNTTLYSKFNVNSTSELLRKAAALDHLYPLFFKEAYSSLIL